MHYKLYSRICQHLSFYLQSLAIYDIMVKSLKKGREYMASVSLTIRIDEDDKRTIEQFAKKDDRSINYVVNQAIKEFIKKNLSDKEE